MEIFTTLLEAKTLIENLRREHSMIIPHNSLGYKPPVPEVMLPRDQHPIVKKLALEVVP